MAVHAAVGPRDHRRSQLSVQTQPPGEIRVGDHRRWPSRPRHRVLSAPRWPDTRRRLRHPRRLRPTGRRLVEDVADLPHLLPHPALVAARLDDAAVDRRRRLPVGSPRRRLPHAVRGPLPTRRTASRASLLSPVRRPRPTGGLDRSRRLARRPCHLRNRHLVQAVHPELPRPFRRTAAAHRAVPPGIGLRRPARDDRGRRQLGRADPRRGIRRLPIQPG